VTTSAKIDWNKVPDKERRAIANRIFVPRGFTDEFLETMQELRAGAGEDAEAMCLVVVGERGVGKSAFLKHYAAQYPPVEIDDGNVRTRTRPVVYVSFPSSPTLKGAAEEFTRELLGEESTRQTRTKLTALIKKTLKDLQTEIVIADEFQHVQEEGSKGKSVVADWLKDIIKTTGVPFVLSGMPETIDIIEADEQLHSLTEEPTIIAPYVWDDVPSKRAWCALLAEIDKGLPFNERSDLAEINTARNLFDCSQGYLRQLRTILRIATARAIKNQSGCLSWDDLAAGYNRLPKSPLVKGNPFDRNRLFIRD
jgi:hypothetical protein